MFGALIEKSSCLIWGGIAGSAGACAVRDGDRSKDAIHEKTKRIGLAALAGAATTAAGILLGEIGKSIPAGTCAAVRNFVGNFAATIYDQYLSLPGGIQIGLPLLALAALTAFAWKKFGPTNVASPAEDLQVKKS